MHVMSLNLLTSRKSPLILPRTIDESLHFRSFFRKPKRIRLLSTCANAVYNVMQSLKDICSIRIFCNFEIRRQFSELKIDEIQKEHISLSLSLILSICRCTLIFSKGCACTSLSLSFSLFTFAKTVWIQIRHEWNSGKNVLSI